MHSTRQQSSPALHAHIASIFPDEDHLADSLNWASNSIVNAADAGERELRVLLGEALTAHEMTMLADIGGYGILERLCALTDRDRTFWIAVQIDAWMKAASARPGWPRFDPEAFVRWLVLGLTRTLIRDVIPKYVAPASK